VGVSLYPDHARDPAALIASADEAMYREKMVSDNGLQPPK
jgi:GGDEF domain-containing protein